jgi:multidrug efflux system membrane fusion protein
MFIVETLKSRWGTLTLLGALGLLGAYEWKSARRLAALESPAHAAPRPAPQVVLAEGRVTTYPGRELTVGAEIGGRVARVFAEERQAVKRGEKLAEIDVAEQKAALAEANARVKEVDTELAFQESELSRAERLLSGRALPEAARDRTRLERDAAKARRVSLRASALRLSTLLAKANTAAPIDGVVLERHAEAGEMVSAGSPLFTLADLGRLRVEAEVGEFDAPRVVLGAKARVRAEGHEGRVFEATVEEIPDRVVARAQKPLDPSRPVDTRVLLVKLALSDASGLKLGQRVEVEIPRTAPGR